MNEMISRHVRVDRTRSSKDMLKATGRHQYVDDTVIRTMPKGAGGEVEVVFFKLDLSKRDGWLDQRRRPRKGIRVAWAEICRSVFTGKGQ